MATAALEVGCFFGCLVLGFGLVCVCFFLFSERQKNNGGHKAAWNLTP